MENTEVGRQGSGTFRMYLEKDYDDCSAVYFGADESLGIEMQHIRPLGDEYNAEPILNFSVVEPCNRV